MKDKEKLVHIDKTKKQLLIKTYVNWDFGADNKAVSPQ
jgi:hypothetical protein